MRESGGGAENNNFLEWAYHFAESVKNLTRQGKKVLLIYDGYRSHMSLPVLRLFSESIFFYAIPAHTSGKTQPLDVVAFGMFKWRLNQIISEGAHRFECIGCSLYDLRDLMTATFKYTFTYDTIHSFFRRSGVWPLDLMKLLHVPRPDDATLTTVLAVDSMEKMLVQGGEQLANEVFAIRMTFLETGFVDTKRGYVLTREQALSAVKKTAAEMQRENAVRELKQRQIELNAAAKQKKNRVEAARLQELAMWRRTKMPKMNVVVFKAQFRTLKERCAAAKLRIAKEKLNGAHSCDVAVKLVSLFVKICNFS